MDIKIGFSHSPRELVINSDETQEAVVAKVREAVASEKVLELQDAKGAKFFINPAEIAHLEIGTSTARTVGFAGA
ncbi:DUF3107 domain-containing protein [Corynebacterium halotolerans]|uniref:DUF3107 domain-containing protein n=1 Tax=Corynebacterium halotolerans TaxID=225326 RepID=UPI003CE889FF